MNYLADIAKWPPRTLLAARGLAPGLLLGVLASLMSIAVTLALPAVSPLLIAIVLGALLRNTVPLPASVEPGLAFTSRRLLRLGVVLLGLQVMLGDIVGLGVDVILLVVAVVAVGIGAILGIGRMWGVGPSQRLLIACGFSICGAAAVAAVEGVLGDDAEDHEETATAIALVVLFGTLMIPLVPLLVGLLGLGEEAGGVLVGASVHEVAQVVAAGSALGATALDLAIVVKLARVLTLAPVMVLIGLAHRAVPSADTPSARRLPPLVPLFVVGFVAMMLLRSTGVLSEGALRWGEVAQTALLTAAMFALGTGIRFGSLLRVGPRPFLLALAGTAVVTAVSVAGVLLLHSGS
ncbi:YeiH family protein [Nocardiopsis listeri]|uniref:YeiH family protein n=1 Tax=Nocardiopsis listeri TaxID=53440 RepID=UPI000831C76F|nr:putative sulfate exporter family transporter [Nocardiopsis listeri]